MKSICKMNLVIAFLIFSGFSCSKGGNGNATPPPPPPPPPPPVVNSIYKADAYFTSANKTFLFTQQILNPNFLTTAETYPSIEVDSSTQYQTIDGFGYTLTGASAQLIRQMDNASRASLLTELFGNSSSSIGISFLRISIGASDLSVNVFSYDDMPAGQTDPTLANFSLSDDITYLVPLLKEIIAINPNIKILGSPWSAPTWMKTNTNSVGGALQSIYYSAYANYLVKYVQAMKAQGININAITVQNEPENPNNNPSMTMTAAEQTTFIKNNLGPAFQAANLSTKIIIYDHNCDHPNYPTAVLGDATANTFIDGSAFHLYGGDISAMSTVHYAYPNKNVYFTEQFTSATGSFSGDFLWHTENVLLGSMRNWSKTTLIWNLASDPTVSMHTNGGCSDCLGALTISGNTVSRNVAYYIIGQASKYIPAGSVRLASTDISGAVNAAFLTPSGKKVLIVLNKGAGSLTFNIKYKGSTLKTTLPGTTAGTYVW